MSESILRLLMRGIRLDPRSLLGGHASNFRLLSEVPIAIDVTGLDMDKLEPPRCDERAKAPYPLVWIEKRFDKYASRNDATGAIEEHDVQVRWGALVREIDRDEIAAEILKSGNGPQEAGMNLDAYCAVAARGLRCLTFFCTERFVAMVGECVIPQQENGSLVPLLPVDEARLPAVDPDGHVAGTLKLVSVFQHVVKLVPPERRPAEHRAAITNVVRASHFAINTFALLNCKNVLLEDRDPNQVARHRRKRQGKTGIEWKVLSVQRVGAARGQSGAAASDKLTRAHLVRGHFKTYTKEAPLLGRAVGRFWWSPVARGNAERGAILKDYSVEENPNG